LSVLLLNLHRFGHFWRKNPRFLSLFSVCLLTIQETTFNKIKPLRGGRLQSVLIDAGDCDRRMVDRCIQDVTVWPLLLRETGLNGSLSHLQTTLTTLLEIQTARARLNTPSATPRPPPSRAADLRASKNKTTTWSIGKPSGARHAFTAAPSVRCRLGVQNSGGLGRIARG